METIKNTEQNINPDAPVVVALDIGTTKIATIIGTKNKHGKIEVLAYANVPSKGVLRGAVANIKDATESIARSIQEAAAKANVEVVEVVVGVAGQYVRSYNQSTSLTISGDEVKESDINKMLDDIKQISQKPGEKIISVIPQDFEIDRVPDIIYPIGYSGKHIKGNFHVVSVNESIIKNIAKCVNANKINVQEFYLEAIASAASVLTEEQKESGVCLIDIGGGTTDIAIYHENIIKYSAVIPLGGNVITKDVKQLCKLTEKQAEKLKIEQGHAFPFDDLKTKNLKLIRKSDNLLDKSEQASTVNLYYLAEVINARVEEIINYVDGHLEASGYKDKLSAGIILTGGGSLLKGIQNVFMANLGINTSVGVPNQHISTNVQELISPVYSTAIGLLILGFQNVSEKDDNTVEEQSKKETKEDNALAKKRSSNFMSSIFKGIKGILETPDNLDN